MQLQLTKREYGKILQCMDAIAFDPDVHDLSHYRQTVLKTLSDIFGYRQSVFWFANNNGHLGDPLLNNIKDKILYEYLDFYQPLDILIPNNLSSVGSDRVVKIDDVLSFSTFVESDYFQEFFRKHQFTDEMGVYIFNKNHLVAVIGLIRKEGEKRFDEQDRIRLQFLVKSIESAFTAYATLMNGYRKEKKFS